MFRHRLLPPPRLVCTSTARALEAEGVLAMHGDQLLREVKGDLVLEARALPCPSGQATHPDCLASLLSVPAVLASRVLSPAAVDGDKVVKRA